MTSNGDRPLEYVCENDDCEDVGKMRTVHPEGSSECPTCGWFMVAIQ